MGIKKILIIGLIAGLFMGIALFLTGAITAYIIYGPQFAPPDKFSQQQMNAWYFFWTKLVIGCFFGIIFAFVYVKLYLPVIGGGCLKGLLYGFFLWFIISLWNISHPIIYGPLNIHDYLFWAIYMLGGFLVFGAALGYFYRKIFSNKTT
jgi:hypothetical protein